MGMSAAHCQGKCQGISECLESGHPVLYRSQSLRLLLAHAASGLYCSVFLLVSLRSNAEHWMAT